MDNSDEEVDHKKEKEEQIKKQTEELEKSIKDSAKELVGIQKTCSHPKESNKIKDINPEGTADIRKLCGLCSLVLGYPTRDQMDEWTGAKKDKQEKDSKK